MRAAAPNRWRPISTGLPSWWLPQPAPDWFLVDRYWAGAALKDLDALLIVNKNDLGSGAIEADSTNIAVCT